VQHDLNERHEGDSEPDHVPVARIFLATLAAAAFALVSGSCGLFTTETVPVAMVSGRDDHGLLERPAIGLQRSPTDKTVTATVHDGDFVLVLRREGLWALVHRVPGPEEGWIADHDLRGEAVDVGPPPRRVTFVNADAAGGAVRVFVRYTADGSTAWVPASSLKEVGAR
jgi:hypothetical protein